MPWIYLIVATGDIHEDIPQAQAAAREGADVIAVIRSTGQSLLDYVPEGATREGYAGTYATQENFRLMRAALDDVSRELGRYVRLTNYASGLCMPEIAALAGLERLDMMLNDCMYGIIFRDINPQRTFIDQRFSRQVHARAGIVINTGEDNYLTTADAVDAAHTVVVSQLLNERFAHEAGLADGQLGLGHAFEINPALPESLRLELAHAQLVRELFPDAPLKYMPPTKHMTGNVFAGYLLDGFFNLVGTMTGQGILLVGMMTEGIVTPFLSDRDLALENVRYVLRRGRRAGRGLPPGAGRLRRDAGPAGAVRGGRAAREDRRRRAAAGDRRRHVRHHQAARDGGEARRGRTTPTATTTRPCSCWTGWADDDRRRPPGAECRRIPRPPGPRRPARRRPARARPARQEYRRGEDRRGDTHRGGGEAARPARTGTRPVTAWSQRRRSRRRSRTTPGPRAPRCNSAGAVGFGRRRAGRAGRRGPGPRHRRDPRPGEKFLRRVAALTRR